MPGVLITSLTLRDRVDSDVIRVSTGGALFAVRLPRGINCKNNWRIAGVYARQ